MADEPGTGELSRKIEDFRRDVRDDVVQILSRLDQFVLREVYMTERDAMRDQIREVKEEMVTARRSARAAILAGISSIVAAIVVAVVLGAMKGTGH